MNNMLKEFKEFINRGNVVDLAVAVVIGAAFTALITAFTDGVLLQIVAALVGEPNFDTLTIDLGDTPIYYGMFLTALIRFVLVASAVFVVVKALNEMQHRRARGEAPADEEPPPPTDVELLAEIRDLLAAQRPPSV
ncbi:MAG: large conductance mechanosensitive channel protein MscL [Acidimicrobiales bacterium]